MDPSCIFPYSILVIYLTVFRSSYFWEGSHCFSWPGSGVENHADGLIFFHIYIVSYSSPIRNKKQMSHFIPGKIADERVDDVSVTS